METMMKRSIVLVHCLHSFEVLEKVFLGKVEGKDQKNIHENNKTVQIFITTINDLIESLRQLITLRLKSKMETIIKLQLFFHVTT